jgi:hypothetical protein
MRQMLCVCLLSASAFAQSGDPGVFSNSGDVGGPAIKGSVEFSNGQYRIGGSGANIWAKQDQFQYLWREMTGNFTVTASMRFVGQGAAHRKAGIMSASRWNLMRLTPISWSTATACPRFSGVASRAKIPTPSIFRSTVRARSS